MKHKERVVSRFRQWLARHNELEHWSLVVISGAALTLLEIVVLNGGAIYYASTADGSRLYLLSSIVQSLAAVLAVLVTVSLVVTQLAAQEYTPRVVNLRLTDFWLWSAVGIYLAAIGWSLVVLGGLGSWISAQGGGDRTSVNVALVLALAALLYVVPFTIATLKSVQLSKIAQRSDYASLDELLRKAVNAGIMPVYSDALDGFTTRVKARLDRSRGAVAEAHDTVRLYRLVGRYACQRRSPEAVAEVMRQLTRMTTYCNAFPRQWRSAADVFNEAVKELYVYSGEWIGKPQT